MKKNQLPLLLAVWFVLAFLAIVFHARVFARLLPIFSVVFVVWILIYTILSVIPDKAPKTEVKPEKKNTDKHQ